MMLAGSGGLLLRRRWGLTLAGLAGIAWAISALGYVLTNYLVMERIGRASGSASPWQRIDWLVGLGVGVIAVVVGALLIPLDRQPRWAGVDDGPEPRNRRLALAAHAAWGLISVTASATFARWLCLACGMTTKGPVITGLVAASCLAALVVILAYGTFRKQSPTACSTWNNPSYTSSDS
jgi:hypothetical protein